ncbi:MAG: ATP-binding protein [Armatimonadetes bacterium]|nr:ATP-binding protein [Armatimonadota bacterium]
MPELEAKPIFGASVLETLTTGMYTDPLDAIRELIQNSYDSICEANRQGQLKAGQPQITVTICEDDRELRVHDNGVGVKAEIAGSTLSNVGQSSKRIGVDVGFRGIGRLHSVAYCDSLTFKTSALGEDVATVVTINAAGLRELMRPGNASDDTAEEILYACTDIERVAEDPSSHFFEATLKGVAASVPRLLDFKEVHSYLAQVAPVDFDTAFFFAQKVREFAQKNKLDLVHVPILLHAGNNERAVFKPYKMTYRPLRELKDDSKDSERIEVSDIAFYPEAPNSNSPYWIWYSEGNLLGQIGDKGAAGFRLRKQNMSVGGTSRVDELLQETRFSRYFIGEIHVRSAECIPNARRDGFEDTTAWVAIKEEIAQFLKEREKEVRTSSKLRSDKVGKSIRAAIQAAEKATSEATAGITSKQEREKLLQSIEDHRSKLEEISPVKVPEELKEELTRAHEGLERAQETVESAEFVLQKAKGQLDRKQKKLLQDILEILESCLDEATFREARTAIMAKFEPKDDS